MAVALDSERQPRDLVIVIDWRYRPRGVLVYYVRTEPYGDDVYAHRALEVLDVAERAAYERIGSAPARRDYLAAHVLARTILGDLLGADASRIRFRTMPGGRPELASPVVAPPLRFSLAHADGVALCAVTAGRTVGADVESDANLGPDPEGVAATICSDAELEALRQLPAVERARRFLSLWTEKEALVEALGIGFRRPFARSPIPGTRWTVTSLRLTPHHVAAIAVVSLPGETIPIRVAEAACFDGATLSRAYRGASLSL
ncbi:MAG TPA: 4'-phosphopantetheinyl transferase superfamily protein [Gemmatimonadales bacterium]